MSRTHRAFLAAGLLLAVAAADPAAAQTPDSLIAASYSGQSRFRVNIDGGAVFGGEYDGGISSGGIAREGAGTRMMWYPQKAAFRAGWIDGTQWDDANIGYFSVAAGQAVRASGDGGTAFGVRSTAAGSSTFAVGEDNTASGAASVALGYHAHTNARQGSFVFGDRSTVDTIRAGVNHSANWRVSGGFRIFTSSNLSTGVTLQSGASISNLGQANAVISTSTGAYLSTSGIWENNSDVNRKHLFASVDGEDVLTRLRALPIQTWTYRVEDSRVRHLGPMAQDFHAAFGLGNNERTIGTVDADGVALAAAQALERRTAEQRARIEALEAENAALRGETETLRARLDRIEALLIEQGASTDRRHRQ
jgi:hypothetical protein